MANETEREFRESQFQHKDAVYAHHGYVVYPRLTLKTFGCLIDRLTRENQLYGNNVAYANRAVLLVLKERYEAANVERLRAPMIYSYYIELMKDIERQLYGDLVGYLIVRPVCIRNAPRDAEIELTIYHSSARGSVRFEMRNAVWQLHYLVKGIPTDEMWFRISPKRPTVKLELISKAGIFGFFKFRRVHWGEPVELNVLDFLGRKSLVDVNFGKIKLRMKFIWRPSNWINQEGQANA